MAYHSPADEYRYLFELRRLTEQGPFADLDSQEIDAVLDAAAKLAQSEIAPLQRRGDCRKPVLENGIVRTSPGFGEAYRSFAAGGWVGMSAGERYGGFGFPGTLRNACNEMFNGTCMAFGLNPMLTQCQIDALEQHASEELKEIYLPRLISGEWCGTMNITEPQAGSDVGAIRTRAVAAGDGSYRLTGEKIFISWADSDFAGNICHLVLARGENAARGSKGLSLFLVPKLIPGPDGQPGRRNGVSIAALEEKLGIHGSPTALVRFESARGWLVGVTGGGLAAMFTMMNNARLGVGTQGVAVAEAAWQEAAEYAHTRRQGRTLSGETGSIIGHGNIRRTLARAKAQIFAARAICTDCAFALDMAQFSGEAAWQHRAALLTPIAKAFGSDTGVETALRMLGIFGGSGYIEATGAAQFLRDVIVTTIYEGTNDIQALDLAGRKLADSGAAMNSLLDEVRIAAESADGCEFSPALLDAESETRRAAAWMVGRSGDTQSAAASTPFLRAVALLLGARWHLAASGDGGERQALARVYFQRLLPAVRELCREVVSGDADLSSVTL